MGASVVTSTCSSTAVDPSIIRDPRRPSGYRHVYYAGRSDSWSAKIKAGRRLIHLGYYTNPRDGAVAVCEWFAARFGPNWPETERNRLVVPWRVRHSPKLGKAIVEAWVMGSPSPTIVAVVPWPSFEDRPDDRQRQSLAKRKAIARKHLVPWLRREFGVFAPVSLWRHNPAPRVTVRNSTRSGTRSRSGVGRFERVNHEHVPPLFTDTPSGFPLSAG